MKLPMTFCLTFDDGFKVHHDIVAPMLEAHGWRGTFNVPTEFMKSNHAPLTADQLWDCRLNGNENNLMTWDDVRDLVRRGHEVYPHTLGHVDLLQLEQMGKIDELLRQIAESRSQFIAELGYEPKFFCSPHNSWSETILAAIRGHGMELLNCSRRNFPTQPTSKPPAPSISEYVLNEWSCGTAHIDIMIHGVDGTRGGWEPFATVEEFGKFLDELKDLEQSRYVRVVSYQSSHVGPGLFLRERLFVRRVTNKLRRMIFSL